MKEIYQNVRESCDVSSITRAPLSRVSGKSEGVAGMSGTTGDSGIETSTIDMLL